MKTGAGFALLMVIACAACSSTRAQSDDGAREWSTPSATVYRFSATAPTDHAFGYVPASREGVFEWKTLSLRFDNRAFFEGNHLIFVVDVEAKNAGTRDFPWEDYTLYVGLRDSNGDWNYRLLFTNAKPGKISPRQEARYRYTTRLPGAAIPRDYVVVAQSFFGGRDTAFPFALRSPR